MPLRDVLDLGEVALRPERARRLAIVGGAVGGCLAMYFYRGGLNLKLGSCAPSLPDLDAGKLAVAFMAGAVGGWLLCTGSLRIRRPQARGQGWTVGLIGVAGGIVLALAQAMMDKGPMGLSTKYWPEFFVFGSVATATSIAVLQFTRFRSLAEALLQAIVPAIPAELFYAGVAGLRLKGWWPPVDWLGPRGKVDRDIWCWSAYVVVACCVYLAAIVLTLYVSGRPKRTRSK